VARYWFAWITIINEPRGGAPTLPRHPPPPTAFGRAHGPPHDTPCIEIEPRGPRQPAGTRGHKREIAHPPTILRRHGKLLIAAIRDGGGLPLPHRHGANRAPSTPGHDVSEPPELGDALVATDAACSCEPVPPRPYAVGFPRLLMEHAHPGDEGLIGCAHEDSLADAARARSRVGSPVTLDTWAARETPRPAPA